MKVDWAALLVVAGVSVAATLVFTVLVALAVRLLSVARVARGSGGTAVLPYRAGQACLGLAGLLVLFCLWLIVPQFH